MGSFAQRLRDAMQSAGLKAVDLHDRTGISKASISEYLSGNYEPKQKNVYRLAEALHVAPSYLMGLSEQEPPASAAQPAPQKSDGLPELNARDEREIERDLADMMHSVAMANCTAPGEHELGHAVCTPDANTSWISAYTLALNTDRIEREANTFAVELLLPDDFVRENEGCSIYQLARLRGVPEELVELKGIA